MKLYRSRGPRNTGTDLNIGIEQSCKSQYRLSCCEIACAAGIALMPSTMFKNNLSYSFIKGLPVLPRSNQFLSSPYFRFLLQPQINSALNFSCFLFSLVAFMEWRQTYLQASVKLFNSAIFQKYGKFTGFSITPITLRHMSGGIHKMSLLCKMLCQTAN